MKSVIEQGKLAKVASTKLALLASDEKNQMLLAMADALLARKKEITAVNQADIEKAKENHLSDAFIDRLTLTDSRIDSMVEGLKIIAQAKDPIGKVYDGWKTDNQLHIEKVCVPLGVIGMIYESRPNVTVDAAGLALKSGNAILLRGGSNAHYTNRKLTEIMVEACQPYHLPNGAIQYLENPSRDAIIELVTCEDYVDVVIPRGGKSLKATIIEHAKVPAIITGAGLCHTYIDANHDGIDVLAIIENAKTQRTGVCNATETLLLHKEIADDKKLAIFEHLSSLGVEIYGCQQSKTLLPSIHLVTDESYDTEYLSMAISVRIVNTLEEAIEHINQHGTKHSEAILTSCYQASEKFLNEVDASTVYVNASTRFTDGSVFGFGGEIGISTQKLHARGPMGIEALTTSKYLVRGNGQIRK